MAQITIGDVTGATTLEIDDNSFPGRSKLENLISGTANFIHDLPRPLGAVSFQSATFSATLESPKIPIGKGRSLTVKAGGNAVLTRYTSTDSPLLGSDPAVPEIKIDNSDNWLSFELDGTLDLTGAASLGSGFGVKIAKSSASKLTTYVLFSGSNGLPTLGHAIERTISSFTLLNSANDIRSQKPGTVCVADSSGSLKVTGAYSLPIAVNELALAEALIPMKIDINPALAVKVSGSVALSGEFSVTSWRKSENELVLALFRKRGTTLSAGFTAGAGLAANEDDTDLIEAFFDAVAPGIDLAASGLTPDDPRYDAINGVLSDSISRAFEISVNAACAASFGNEAVLVYSIDLTADGAATDAALNAALDGDWSLLKTLPHATELRNIVGSSRETKATLSVNLLGVFNYERIADFARSSTVLHNDEDGSVTITDKETAKRIAVASTPYLAHPDKLRLVLYEANLATMVYAAAGGKLTPKLKLNQSLLIYQAKSSPAALRKELRLAAAIGVVTPTQLAAIPISNPRPAHVLIDATQEFTGDSAVNLFFSDPAAGVAHNLDDLKALGRKTLASLLDPSDSVDRRRIEVLNDPETWADMDNQQFPTDSPASYSDWYDVTFWANALHSVAAPLRVALQTVNALPAGVDPSSDAGLKKARKSLSNALADVTHDTHAAFEHGWPIAVMYALAGGNTGAKLTAQWDGSVRIPIPQPFAFQPNTLAKRVAGRAALDQARAAGA